ncbi:hypothetical protein LCGC14_1215680 [marine sediment metagenome]|uniref:Uncharacterized protein n=1 Tax=marine sediment metagenome TaxID=412755 RepID=A0A0F9LGW1_9ZZZZ
MNLSISESESGTHSINYQVFAINGSKEEHLSFGTKKKQKNTQIQTNKNLTFSGVFIGIEVLRSVSYPRHRVSN